MLRAVRSPLLVALAALALLLVVLEMWRPGYFLHDDNATWFAGAYAHDFRTLTQTGRLAEVNFYQYGGEPFIGQGQTAVLYPPVYVAAALAAAVPGDLRATVDWLAAIHLALAVAGFYAWLRGPADGSNGRSGAAPRVDPWPAALGGLIWALNPFVLLLGASWITVTAVAAWLPWLFWAVDGALDGSPPGAGRMDKRNCDPDSREPSRAVPGGHGLPLGFIAGLLVLQGYVQWTAYAFLFAGMYGAFRLLAVRHDGASVARSATATLVAGLVAAAMALPQVLPVLQAAGESKARAQALPLMWELFYRVEPGDLLAAQVGFFRAHFLFDASTALFFCPALVLLPLAVVAFARGDAAARRRLFPLIVLAVIALFLSGSGYVLLNIVPLMQKFRWPFKVFVFAEFFLIAALVWSCAGETGRSTLPSPAQGLRRLPLLVAVLALQVGVAVAEHDTNFLSRAVLPASNAGLPVGLDPAEGRVIAIGDKVPVAETWRHLMYAYGTFFEVPSLGGYNPLVSRASLDFSLGLDVPNRFEEPPTPEMRAILEARAVRYWIVDPRSPRWDEVERLEGMKLLGVRDGAGMKPTSAAGTAAATAAPPQRLIYEDTRALPVAYDTAAPQTALPMRYVGNSMRIQLGGAAGTIAVSVGPTDGWWYRIDGSAWKKGDYRDARLYIPVTAQARDVELTYFDTRFRSGLFISLIISLLAIAVLAAGRLVRWP